MAGSAMWQKFLADTYHKREGRSGPADPLEAGARFAELNYRIARNMADADQRPMWYAGDYFGETVRAHSAQGEAPSRRKP